MNIVRRANVDDSLLQGLIADPILRQLLARRGVLRPEDLDLSLKGLLHYNQMQDIFVAAEEIASAVINRSKIMIAGDYDIDGMSGTALGIRCLRAFGVPQDNISFYVPSRYAGGYGLSVEAVEQAITNQVQLIITVDNGIAAFEGVDFAMRNGIRVVVTDHHEIQDRLPNAVAVVDPKRKDDQFESKNLCGVGVLFYVMSAVRAKLVELNYFKSLQDAPKMSQFLDLVTLGTIGDVMTLDNNNRRLVRAGLTRIRSLQCCLGLQALIRTLNLDPNKINLRTIGFDFCPRFNSSTRIKLDENPSIVNLLTDDLNIANTSAQQLEMCNKRRTDYERVMLAQALEQLEQVYCQGAQAKINGADGANGGASVANSSSIPSSDRLAELMENDASALPEDSADLAKVNGIVLFEPTFLFGLVGLVANRIKERYDKPCMIFGAGLGAGKDGMSSLFKQHAQNQMSVAPAIGTALGIAQGQAQGAAFMGVGPGNQVGTSAQFGQLSPNEQSGAYINQYRLELAAYQNQDRPSFLKDALGLTRAEIGGKHTTAEYEQVVIKVPEVEEVLDQAKQAYYAPDCDKVVVGSARSINGVDLMQVFNYIKEREPEIFVACGGHALAAGASIRAKDIVRFRQLFDEACRECANDVSEKETAVVTDGELPPSHLCLNFARDLEVFGPWGKDYEEPKFDGVFTLESAQLIGNNRHLRMKLRTRNDLIVVDGIKFRANAKEKNLVNLGQVQVKVIYTLNVDRYYQERLQLNVETIEPL